jgi:hypothetical protein
MLLCKNENDVTQEQHRMPPGETTELCELSCAVLLYTCLRDELKLLRTI